jgi:hypothetical protein
MEIEILHALSTIGFYTAGITAFFAALGKSPLGKWVIKVFKREAQDLMLKATTEANKPMEEQLANLDNYTRHHLGPNGTTTPIHERIKQIESR